MKLTIKKPAQQQPAKVYEKIVHTRKGVDPDREFDKTQLKEAGYGNKVHRDYAAHYFRWGWVGNFVDREKTVLEIGCGQDTPLTKVMSGNLSWLPKKYLGVDLNKLTKPFAPKWASYKGEFNFVEDGADLAEECPNGFDLIVSFEVIEHMGKQNGERMLRHAVHLMHDDSTFLLSTPVYNGKHMAANHIHEYEFDELKEMIEDCGLKVVKVYGTFATWNAIKRVCTPSEFTLLEELRQFHSWEVLSTFMASKYPRVASNCAWVLRKAVPF